VLAPGGASPGPPPSAEFALGGVGALRAEPGVSTQCFPFLSAEGLRAAEGEAHKKGSKTLGMD